MAKRKQHAREGGKTETLPPTSLDDDSSKGNIKNTKKKVNVVPPSKQHAVPEKDSMVAIHRFDGVPWVPASVVSLASSEDGSICACLREDGDLELYDTATELMIKSIPGSKNASPTSVVLMSDDDSNKSLHGIRAFLGSMDGTISEVDTQSRHIDDRGVSDSYGGAVWGMDARRLVSSSEKDDVSNDGTSYVIAAACDDGSVRLFGVERDVPGIHLMKSFLPVEGRALCVAWHPQNEQHMLVSGGTDGCLHVWNTETGREITRITVDGMSASGDTPCIWTVKILSDGTIVSGDSLGQVTFWDGRFGTMLGKFNPNGADILSLAISAQNDMVFASGIDPRISVYKKTTGANGTTEWAYLSSKQEHALDIRALCCCSNMSGRDGGDTERLFSGGNDSLIISHAVDRFLKEHPRKMSRVPQRPVISLSRGSDIDGSPHIMATGTGHAVDIWKLPKASEITRELQDGDRLDVHDAPVCIAHLESKQGSHLTSVAISTDGRFVAFADLGHVQCVEILPLSNIEDDLPANPSLIPIVGNHANDGLHGSLGMCSVPLPGSLTGIIHLEFVPNSHTLLCFSHDGNIRVIQSVAKSSDADDIVTIREIHDLRYKTWFKREALKSSARKEYPMFDLVKLSNMGEYLAVVVMNRIFIVSLKGRKIVTQIPSLKASKDSSAIVAIEFVQGDTRLAIATSKSEIGLFDVFSGDACALPGQDDADLHDIKLESNVLGMSASPASSASVVVYSTYSLCHVDFNKPLVDEDDDMSSLGRRPRDKHSKMEAYRARKGRNCRVLPSQHPILHACSLIPDALIVIQKPWEHVWKKKAAPIFRHTYGT